MSPWWASSGTDKNSFETCSSSDMDSEVPSMQLLSGVISSAINSFYDSESIYNSSDDANGDIDGNIDAHADVEVDVEVDDDLSNGKKNKGLDQELSDVLIKATKHTVKGCL